MTTTLQSANRRRTAVVSEFRGFRLPQRWTVDTEHRVLRRTGVSVTVNNRQTFQTHPEAQDYAEAFVA